MNCGITSAIQIHSVPAELASPLTVRCMADGSVGSAITPIVEAARLAPPHSPRTVIHSWLSGEAPCPASLLEWMVAWGGGGEPARLLLQLGERNQVPRSEQYVDQLF